MDLNFEIFMIALLVLSILVVGNFLRDGESNWLEGSLLVVSQDQLVRILVTDINRSSMLLLLSRAGTIQTLMWLLPMASKVPKWSTSP